MAELEKELEAAKSKLGSIKRPPLPISPIELKKDGEELVSVQDQSKNRGDEVGKGFQPEYRKNFNSRLGGSLRNVQIHQVKNIFEI